MDLLAAVLFTIVIVFLAVFLLGFRIFLSKNGKFQTACESGGYIQRSSDYGLTWSKVATSSAWNGMSLSQDGKMQISCKWDGHICLSKDYGLTWNDLSSDNSQWQGINLNR